MKKNLRFFCFLFYCFFGLKKKLIFFFECSILKIFGSAKIWIFWIFFEIFEKIQNPKSSQKYFLRNRIENPLFENLTMPLQALTTNYELLTPTGRSRRVLAGIEATFWQNPRISDPATMGIPIVGASGKRYGGQLNVLNRGSQNLDRAV